jgi:hypothetical protein
MEIKLGIGLDDIAFGMLQDEVKSILGEPDKISETERVDGIVYYFNKLLIKTIFDKEKKYRLSSIEVHNPEVRIFNQRIINKNKREILDLLSANGYKGIEYEDYDLFDILFCEKIWTSFKFEFDRLISVEFDPLFDKNDKIVWPQQLGAVIARDGMIPSTSSNHNCGSDCHDRGKPPANTAKTEIKIGIGIDDIKFGMLQNEVKNILGKPDKISETEKENGIVYYFNKLLFKTKFDKEEECKMYSIETYNPESLMFKQKIINKDKSEILDLLSVNGCKDITYKDYDIFDTLFCEEIWTTFMFEFDRLVSVEFSPLSWGDEKIIWPHCNVRVEDAVMIKHGNGL